MTNRQINKKKSAKRFNDNQVYNLGYLVRNAKDIFIASNGVVMVRDSGKKTYCLPGFGDATETLKRIIQALGVKKEQWFKLWVVANDTIEDYRDTCAEIEVNKSLFLLILYIWNAGYKVAKDGELVFVNRHHGLTIHSGYIMTDDFKNIINYYLEYEQVN